MQITRQLDFQGRYDRYSEMSALAMEFSPDKFLCVTLAARISSPVSKKIL